MREGSECGFGGAGSRVEGKGSGVEGAGSGVSFPVDDAKTQGLISENVYRGERGKTSRCGVTDGQ